MFGLRARHRRSPSDALVVGVALDVDHVSVAALERTAGERPRLLASDAFPAGSPVELAAGLRRFVDAHRLKGAACRLVLPPADYNLKLVERPANVPDEELPDATRWLIRDLVEMDVETAAIAVVPIPDQRGRARTPHMFVVAARAEAVAGLANAIEQAGLRCAGIEVVESAMVGLEASLPEAVAGGAMLRVDAKGSWLTLSSESRLFIARPLRVDSAALEEAASGALATSEPGAAELAERLEPLLLDVQRSLDYYESEYGRAPATRLTLLPGSIELDPLAPALAELLRPLRVEVFSFEHCFALDASPPSRERPGLALACGAALAGDAGFGPALIPDRVRLERTSFGLPRLLQSVGLAAGLIAAFGVHQAWQLRLERAAAAEAGARAGSLQAELDRLRAEAIARGETEGSAVDPATLREQRDARLALLRDLGQSRLDATTRFSSLLVSLARQDSEAVWLERIELSDAGESIALEGRSLEADEVPRLLRRLGGEPSFTGRRFRTFELVRSESPAPGVQFRVATLAPDADAEDRP